ncbi:MAG TPA: Ig-like domain-containing protein [Methylomirabilota bacterium]|nr:Ig-like domain-containing protein [Methylomirabilota bacterium]
MFAGNAQHTAIFEPAARPLNRILWSTTIDLNPGAFAHYGSPLITAANTLITPVKTATDGFRVDAFDAISGAAKYTLTTDYVLPNHGWIPVYNPCLTTGSFGTRLYYPGRGGTIYYIDNPDAVAHGAPVQQVFYTTLANYLANAAAYNGTIFINTPLTADSNGNVFFGFRVQGTAPAPLSTTQSGFARINPNGNGSYVLTGTAAADATMNRNSHNSAPALSNDQTTLYVVARNNISDEGYLIGLDSTTLAPKHRVFLTDPRNDQGAIISDESTASPTVAPDNDVYIGILGNPGNGSRGFLLRFSGDLTIEKTPGGFGWDYTAAIVPASMVPSYPGPSSYLLFAKYNSYAGFGDGDGVNRIAVLDPNTTQIDPHNSAGGLIEMREVLSAIGPTPDENSLSIEFPYAVREWCINTAAVNPSTNSIYVPSEDGHIYSWNLATNSLSQAVELNKGLGQPYVPTIIGPSGIVYTLNGGTLFALGGYDGVAVALVSSVPDLRTVVVGQSLTFTATITNTGPTGVIPTGTVTFQDLTYNELTPVTTTLASNVPLNGSGVATVTTSSLTAGGGFLGNHRITAIYSGDGMFSPGTASLVQKVHARASNTTLTSSPNPSTGGQPVTFTATVASVPPGSIVPTGMVTFLEGSTVLAQVPLNTSSAASFTTSNLFAGDHTITASYYSDTTFASSSGTRLQTVVGGPTPTPSPTPIATRFEVIAPPAVGIFQGFNFTVRAVDQFNNTATNYNGTVHFTSTSQGLLPPDSTLTNGTGTFSANLQTAGTHTITATDTLNASLTGTSNNILVISDIVTPPPSPTPTATPTPTPTATPTPGVTPPPAAQALNLSTRMRVQTGDNVGIGGFIITGSAPKHLLLRAIGPSLTQFGVPDALADTVLELHGPGGFATVTTIGETTPCRRPPFWPLASPRPITWNRRLIRP